MLSARWGICHYDSSIFDPNVFFDKDLNVINLGFFDIKDFSYGSIPFGDNSFQVWFKYIRKSFYHLQAGHRRSDLI